MAEKYFLQAIQLKQAEISRHFPSLSEKEKQAYLQANLIHFSNFENFCLYRYRENPDILSSLYNEKLVTKGLLFHTSNKMRSRILGSGNSTLIALYNQWHGKREALAKVYLMSRTEKIKNKIDLAKLEAEANALEKELSLKSEAVTGKDDKLYRWQEVKEKLKPGEAAIEIIRIPDRDDQSYWISYAVLIISPSTMSHPEIVLLKNGLSMENKFRKYYGNAIKQRFQDVESYRQYWGPIAGKLSGIKKVYLSPDGVFNQINLNALLNPATGKFVIDEIDIQLVGSTKELGTASKTSNRKVKDATLFGFPDYNNKAKTGRPDSARALPVAAVNATEIRIDSAQRFLNGENINELPGTQVEVQSIGTMLRNKNIQHREFMFEAATETELKKLNNPQVLHVATHGYFLSDQNELRKVQTDNPLLRSGLLFAGAKEAFSKTRERGLTDKDDGMLTAYEAMSLDLDQTDLVVLSACETGLGVSSNGEGVYGLQRAFQLAGAKAVLMSLWTVSDEATQKLMTLFYEKWLNGKSVREAFRTAQLELRKEYTEPFYWGAFVMMGN